MSVPYLSSKGSLIIPEVLCTQQFSGYPSFHADAHWLQHTVFLIVTTLAQDKGPGLGIGGARVWRQKPVVAVRAVRRILRRR